MDIHADADLIWNSTSYQVENRVECAKTVVMIRLDVIVIIAKRASIEIQRNQSPPKRHADVSIVKCVE